MDHLSSLILFDECALPARKSQMIPWRRPEFPNVQEALRSRRGALHSASGNLANELKELSIFSPSVYVDGYWLLNNPRLMYLSTLRTTAKNWVGPVFQHDFLTVYWGGPRKIGNSYDEMFEALYPPDPKARPEGTHNSSWIDDLYLCRSPKRFPSFDEIVRPALRNYIRWSLSYVDRRFDATIPDPASEMTKYVQGLQNNPARFIPQEIETPARHVENLIRETLNPFLTPDQRFSMGKVRTRWREIAKTREYSDCLNKATADAIDWIFREAIYLRGHGDVTKGLPAGYSVNSTDTAGVREVPRPAVAKKGANEYVDFLENRWRLFKATSTPSLSSHLDGLSFTSIFEKIRSTDFYSEYKQMLKESNEVKATEKATKCRIEAVAYLMERILPVLYRETREEIFRPPWGWSLSGWCIDNDGTIAMVIGKIAAWVTVKLLMDVNICNVETAAELYYLANERATRRAEEVMPYFTTFISERRKKRIRPILPLAKTG